MAVGVTKKVLLLGCVDGAGGDVVYVGAVAADLTVRCAYISANQSGYLAVAQAIQVIFSHTTALFYGKMAVVHTVPSRALVLWYLHSTRVLYELHYSLVVLHLIV